MKTVVLVAALLSLCSGHVVPKDNSHYVEGESRYVWMSDAEGSQVLVDLEEPADEELHKTRTGANNRYFLYTRRNLKFPQVIEYGNWNSVLSSNYDPTRVVNVIVHGWMQHGNDAMHLLIKTDLLANQDCNVIVVDWRDIALSSYIIASTAVPSVGEHLGNFLHWLTITAGGNWNQFHLIGSGLGAHVVGVAGRGGTIPPARVTGLDPSGPGWQTNDNRLSPSSGQYVEAIHTDGYGLGIFIPSGHVDFYVNGGRHPQPGCMTNTCSHNLATQLFARSISVKIYGQVACMDPWKVSFENCGDYFPMGNADINKRGYVTVDTYF